MVDHHHQHHHHHHLNVYYSNGCVMCPYMHGYGQCPSQYCKQHYDGTYWYKFLWPYAITDANPFLVALYDTQEETVTENVFYPAVTRENVLYPVSLLLYNYMITCRII